jgi:PAS domain S-box-containing protein
MPLLAGATALLFFLEYRREEQRLIESTHAAFAERLNGLETAIGQVVTYLDLAANWAQHYRQSGTSPMLLARYTPLLSYSADGDYFSGGPSDSVQGNVFGSGRPAGRSEAFGSDLGLAVTLLPWFRAAKEESAAILQSYIVTDSLIGAAYPPIPPQAVLPSGGGDMAAAFGRFYEPHKGRHRNPAHEPYFLDAYLDRTGQGLMVTYAHPVYDGERFVGVLASDISLAFLQRYTERMAGLAGRLIIADENGQVLADSEQPGPAPESLNRRLPAGLAARWRDFGDEQGRVGAYYVTSRRLRSAPWFFIHVIESVNLSRSLLLSQITYAVGLLVLVAFLSVAWLAVRRRRLEAALRESELRYGEVYNSTSEAIFIHDAETGRILEVNAAFETMFGYGRDEARGLDVAQISLGESPYGQADALALMRRALAEGPLTCEWRSRRRDGTLFWTEVVLRATSIGGQPRCIAVTRDIDQRKANEAELAGYRAQLEKLVKERSAALQEAQEELIRQERLAVLGRLTATVSHELRNPLGTIANALFIIQQEPGGGTEQHRRALQRCERAIARCNGIVDELLDFTRTWKPALARTQFDAWLARLLVESPPPDGVAHETHLASNATVSMDPEQVRRCVTNILSNAHEAILSVRSSGGRVVVETLSREGQLVARFSDNGPGVAEENRDRLFEPLFSTKSFGVGLGLSIVRQIMRAHGGEASFVDSPQGGATVELTFPLAG